MSLISAGPTWWMLLSILLTLLLVLVLGTVTWSFDLRRSRLPAAVRWEDLDARNTSITAQIVARQADLDNINRLIQERDRIGAEVTVLEERLGNLRAEIASLAEAERQVDLMKHNAADAVEKYALERGRLDAAQADLVRVNAETAEAQQRLDAIRREVERLVQSLPAEIENLKATLKEQENRRSALADDIATLQGERGALLAAREEHTALTVQKAALEHEISAQRALLQEIKSDAAHTKFDEERARISAEIQRLQAEHAALLAAREEIAGLAFRKAGMEQEIAAQRKLLEEIKSDAAHGEYKEEHARIVSDIRRLRAERAALEHQTAQVQTLTAQVDALVARKVALEEDIARLRGEQAPLQDDQSVVEDLVGLPECLKVATVIAHTPQQEQDALGDVETYLAALSLKYNKRTLHAFHTALKINESSQMTVLAGVSGTGKSLLPRRYAEAMGLHFLQIAVEPRWDSPQDLLGFYNYIEKRYRGTELARALVHMDPFNTSELAKTPFEDHVLLVLLDEMNLARVEYYFSEFLSRLEVRPRWKDAFDRDRRADACLPIDIRGRTQGPLQLFPSHNVLFAGTMNDDESTQSLSDKMLDRSNVMQFAAPESFAKPADGPSAPVTTGYRTHTAWRSWIRSVEGLVGGERDKAEEIIKRLAEIMETCGRPFGHRLHEAVLTYVANYPRQRNDTVDDPLADQIEFRILPKLRGLTIEEHQEQFASLAGLIRDNLRDHLLADRLNELVERQRAGSGQFNWRGLNRDRG